MITVSYSKVSTYRDCPQSYHWGYVMGLEPKKMSRPLSFGSDFHKLLECRTDKDKLEAAIEEAYRLSDGVVFEKAYRRSDIGQRALQALR